MKEFIDINHEVEAALKDGRGVVALESTIIAHGMPFPKNIETALKVEEIIRSKGAVPATIGIIEGRIKVGMTKEEIDYLAKAKNVVKVSRRDFPIVVAKKMDGATTVAGTMIIADQAGIRLFVTGGIGGVHRGAAESFDISADLEELKQTDVTVVCAGVKSVLDIGSTLEYLETGGVPVITYGSDDFPAFYSRRSGFTSECRIDSPGEIAELIRMKKAMGLKGGMLVACPIPREYEIDFEIMDVTVEKALMECKEKDITGKRITPFLLERIKELTDGESLEANIKLVFNNAQVGGEIAALLA
jgi:pseudouridine-5'-phosphate glycosidase